MKKAYLVEECLYESNEVLGIFSGERSALAYCEGLAKKLMYRRIGKGNVWTGYDDDGDHVVLAVRGPYTMNVGRRKK
jgi:hypothetical protein